MDYCMCKLSPPFSWDHVVWWNSLRLKCLIQRQSHPLLSLPNLLSSLQQLSLIVTPLSSPKLPLMDSLMVRSDYKTCPRETGGATFLLSTEDTRWAHWKWMYNTKPKNILLVTLFLRYSSLFFNDVLFLICTFEVAFSCVQLSVNETNCIINVLNYIWTEIQLVHICRPKVTGYATEFPPVYGNPWDCSVKL